MHKNPNKLINEKSPYLLQHAHNPVNWFPWCDEAFKEAKNSDKPIFLSIGYSTCHWCHVMEKESFEDIEVAKLMNDTFICIKVDREERPDIDGVYMSVCQMITGSGGWPLTIVMTPDKKPFFAGTYFPKHNRFNRIGMMELIPKLKEVWINQKDDVLKSAEEITASLNRQNNFKEFTKIDETILDKTFDELNARCDEEYGGFGKAPKFPSPHNLLFLIDYYKTNKNPKAILMAEKTLTQMRLGGIYDHIGFGFARYSTDQYWLVPHFEKMLYDQAMLLLAYSDLYSITKNVFYKKTAEEIVEYVLRDMTHLDGGFYSAEDADSEGEEGKFYLWTAEEIRNVLDKDESDFTSNIFNVSENGNWIDESKGIKDGTNILHLKKSYDNLAEELNISVEDLFQKITSIRKKLFNYRKERIHPHKDDKILTDWNALMISALAKAYRTFDNKEFLEAAKKSYNFILRYLKDNSGRLKHRFRDGDAGLPAHIDDYAFFIMASLDLYETEFDVVYLKNAIELNNILFDEFWDDESGGFYSTSNKNEKLIARQKEVYDGAIPSGNSIALLNIIRLMQTSGNVDLENKILKLINYFSGFVSRSPSAFTMFIYALSKYFKSGLEIVIVCNHFNEVVNKSLQIINSFNETTKSIIIKTDNNSGELDLLIPFTSGMQIMNNIPTFYVCNNYSCSKPTNSLTDLRDLLSKQ